MDKSEIISFFKSLQQSISSALEIEDGVAKFSSDEWQREGGGGGVSNVLKNGKIFEKGGVNFSEVYGKTPVQILKSLEIEGTPDFSATGVSIVIHPSSPKVPIIHMNVRYFEMSNGMWWFGGGIDLTPIYIVDEDARFFHKQLKATCDQFNHTFYPKYKNWADDYFYITHRKETRGIGGIFFDHLGRNNEISKDDAFSFVKSVGETFAPSYISIVQRHKEETFSELEKKWQLVRRGRYAEFNLVIDRGTKFGLETDGRTESILMSLPPLAAWEYDYKPNVDSAEYNTLIKLRKGIDWV